VNVKTIELSLEAAKAMLPVAEREMEIACNEADAAHQRYEELKRLVSELRAKTTNSILPLQNGESLRKRRPKGFAADAIQNLLKEFPQGLMLDRIENTLGIDYSTIYRTLSDPKRNKGRFVQTEDGAWKNAA
jgi:hypothetical protein